MTSPVPSMAGVHLLSSLRHTDARGELRKVVTSAGLARVGASAEFDEVVTTTNLSAGTLRGLHYQCNPHQQTKTLWVTRGALFDVVVDLREVSPTYGRWMCVTLSALDNYALHVPEGVAHGYLTLDDDTSISYLISGAHSPKHARTLAWDDSSLGIPWPRAVTSISSSDLSGHPWPPPS